MGAAPKYIGGDHPQTVGISRQSSSRLNSIVARGQFSKSPREAADARYTAMQVGCGLRAAPTPVGRLCPLNLRPPLPVSVSALKQHRTADLKQEAEARWQISRRYAKTRRIDPTLSKNQTSILIQLRTGHAPLQQHLFRLRKAESAMCPTCGTNEETVIHYLLHCPTWKRARAPLRRALPAFRTLLRTLLSSPEALPTLFGYIKATGRFAAGTGRPNQNASRAAQAQG